LEALNPRLEQAGHRHSSCTPAKAWLAGLLTPEPGGSALDYDRVYRLKLRIPNCLSCLMAASLISLQQPTISRASLRHDGRSAYQEAMEAVGGRPCLFGEPSRCISESRRGGASFVHRARARACTAECHTRHVLEYFEASRGACLSPHLRPRRVKPAQPCGFSRRPAPCCGRPSALAHTAAPYRQPVRERDDAGTSCADLRRVRPMHLRPPRSCGEYPNGPISGCL